MQRTLFLILILLELHIGLSAVIVPEELPSILSLVYSNIPPVKKGSDSRVGFGFRLGEHADVQLLFEFGPQKSTSPLGPNAASTNKRDINPKLYGEAYIKDEKAEGANWLKSWSKDFQKKQNKKRNGNSKPNNAVLHTVPLLSNEASKQLQMLYRQGGNGLVLELLNQTTTANLSSENNKKELIEELMDVSLD